MCNCTYIMLHKQYPAFALSVKFYGVLYCIFYSPKNQVNFCTHNALSPWRNGNLKVGSHFPETDLFPAKYLMLILHQFHSQFVFGYQLKTARCSSKITNESIVIHGDEPNCAWNIQLKYLRLGLKNNYAWQISVYFKWRLHNKGMLR